MGAVIILFWIIGFLVGLAISKYVTNGVYKKLIAVAGMVAVLVAGFNGYLSEAIALSPFP